MLVAVGCKSSYLHPEPQVAVRSDCGEGRQKGKQFMTLVCPSNTMSRSPFSPSNVLDLESMHGFHNYSAGLAWEAFCSPLNFDHQTSCEIKNRVLQIQLGRDGQPLILKA